MKRFLLAFVLMATFATIIAATVASSKARADGEGGRPSCSDDPYQFGCPKWQP